MTDKFFKLSQELTARKDLKPSCKVLYAVIADAQGQNGECWPGMKRLMIKTGLSYQTILRSIHNLEHAGFLEVIRRGRGRVNHYKTSTKMVQVPKRDQYQNGTTGNTKMVQEPVPKWHPNQTKTNMNQTNKKKNNKKEKFLDFVFLSDAEYDKLKERLGKSETEDFIERLNNYIGSKGRKYKSHYHTILSWKRNDGKKSKRKNRDFNQQQPSGDVIEMS